MTILRIQHRKWPRTPGIIRKYLYKFTAADRIADREPVCLVQTTTGIDPGNATERIVHYAHSALYRVLDLISVQCLEQPLQRTPGIRRHILNAIMRREVFACVWRALFGQ